MYGMWQQQILAEIQTIQHKPAMIWTTERPEAEQQCKRFGEAYKARQPKILVPANRKRPRATNYSGVLFGMQIHS